MKTKPPLEAVVKDEVLNWLNKQEGIWAWRRNVALIRFAAKKGKGKDRFVRFGQKGMSDIEGIVGVDDTVSLMPTETVTLGLHLEVEVKRQGEEPTDNQAIWLAAIEAAGGIGLWADSVEMVERKLRAALAARGYEL